MKKNKQRRRSSKKRTVKAARHGRGWSDWLRLLVLDVFVVQANGLLLNRKYEKGGKGRLP